MAIQIIRPVMNDMPSKYPEQRPCQGILADLSIDQYSLSHDLQDLVACVSFIGRVVDDYNDEADQGDSSKGLVQTAWVRDLRKSLQFLAEAPPSNYIRNLAEKELPEILRTCRQSQNSPVSGVEQFHR